MLDMFNPKEDMASFSHASDSIGRKVRIIMLKTQVFSTIAFGIEALHYRPNRPDQGRSFRVLEKYPSEECLLRRVRGTCMLNPPLAPRIHIMCELS
jgi:hypothetical protein